MKHSFASKMHKLGVAAGLVLGAVVCALGTYFVSHYPVLWASIQEPGDSEVAKEEYWQDRIHAAGGPTAYEEFVHSVSGKDATEEHELAHTFGDALYKVQGESGLAVCDGRVSYGCFHSIVGHAIEEHGPSEVASLVRFCQTSPSTDLSSCQHGVGHGIVGHFGYDREDLDEALALCKSAAVPDPIDSCYAGAFMEYNMRTMLGAYATVRPLGDNPLAPCDSLGPEYQYACAFQQPRWWLSAVDGQAPGKDMYTKLGAWCDQLGRTPAATRACYEGLGENTPATAGYAPDTVASLCAASSDSTLHRLYCTAFAASTIGDTRGQDEGLRVCRSLAGPAHQYCSAYVLKGASIINPLPAPAL